MFNFPIDVLLSWPIPSSHPETRGPEIWIFSAIFLFLTTSAVGIRLYSRIAIRKWLGLDDALIMVAYICSVTVTSISAIGTSRYGWDRHVWDNDLNNIPKSLKMLYFARIFWGISSSCVRLSVIMLLYRLLDSCNAPRRYVLVLHATLWFNILLLIYYTISGIFPCFPIRAYWTFPIIEHAKCLNDGLSMQVAAIINTLAELQLATLPVIGVFRLGVDKRQRWSVVSVLSLGYIVCLMGIIRTYYIFKAFLTWDLTWYSNPQWTCSEIEIDLAIIAACAAPIRPFLTRIYKNMRPQPPASTHPVPLASNDEKHELPTYPKSTMKTLPETRKTSAATTSQTLLSSADDTIQDWSPIQPARKPLTTSPADAEAWSSTIAARNVDLEGLVTEGYGYSVTITGPSKAKMTWARKGLRGLSLKRRDKNDIREVGEDEESRPATGMKTTELVVVSSARPVGERRNFWDNAVDTGQMSAANMTFLTGFTEEKEDEAAAAGDSNNDASRRSPTNFSHPNNTSRQRQYAHGTGSPEPASPTKLLPRIPSLPEEDVPDASDDRDGQ